MPYSISWEENGFQWIFSGKVHVDEIAEAKQAFYDDPRMENTRWMIFDFLKVTEFTSEYEDIHEHAAKDKEVSQTIPGAKLALLVDKPQFRLLSEMYRRSAQELNNTWTVEIFRTRRQAEQWLGLKPNSTNPFKKQ